MFTVKPKITPKFSKGIAVSTWRKKISKEMEINGDSWDGVEYVYVGRTQNEKYHGQRMNADWLDERWVYGHAGGDERAFFVWTKDFVYFGITYDGLQEARSVPKNPENMKNEPVLFGQG